MRRYLIQDEKCQYFGIVVTERNRSVVIAKLRGLPIAPVGNNITAFRICDTNYYIHYYKKMDMLGIFCTDSDGNQLLSGRYSADALPAYVKCGRYELTSGLENCFKR